MISFSDQLKSLHKWTNEAKTFSIANFFRSIWPWSEVLFNILLMVQWSKEIVGESVSILVDCQTKQTPLTCTAFFHLGTIGMLKCSCKSRLTAECWGFSVIIYLVWKPETVASTLNGTIYGHRFPLSCHQLRDFTTAFFLLQTCKLLFEVLPNLWLISTFIQQF